MIQGVVRALDGVASAVCVHGHSPLFSWPVWSALFPLEQFSSSETGKRCATVDGRSPLSSWHVWSALFPLE